MNKKMLSAGVRDARVKYSGYGSLSTSSAVALISPAELRERVIKAARERHAEANAKET